MIDALMGHDISPVATELATDIVLKATFVLMAAGLLALALRRTSSAVRHMVWSAAFVILLVAPVVSVMFPSWRIDRVSLPQHDAASGSLVTAVPNGHSASQITRKTTGEVPAHVPVIESPKTRSTTDKIVTILVALWLCVAVAMLLRLLLHVFRVGRIVSRAQANDCQALRELAAPLKESLGIHRPARIVMSEEVTMPFAWGVFDPAVVFPAAAKDWPIDRKRSVLLHEFAHVARWDYLIHIVVEIVRAFYWPNPLVWLAARQKAAERERACDDLALRQGTPCREYASHLLHVARLQLEPCVPVGAVTMTAKTSLAQRIQYVMDTKLDRTPVRPDRMSYAMLLVFFVALPLGTFEVTASEWQIPEVEQLVSELRHADDPVVRGRAAWWLGEHEARDGVEPLIDGLRDESAGVRIAAAWALGEIKDDESVAPLVETLERDDDALVREMAVLALGEIEDPSAVDPLVAAFKGDDDMRMAVVWALGEIENNGSRKAERARDDAFDALGRRPWDNDQVWAGNLDYRKSSSKDLPALIGRLSSDDYETRRDAALSLGFLGIRHQYESTKEVVLVVDALLVTLRDPEPEVRAAAVWSLDEINPSRSARRKR